MDLDVGLTLALLDEGRYRSSRSVFATPGSPQDDADEGIPTRHRRRDEATLGTVTVDLLIPLDQVVGKVGICK